MIVRVTQKFVALSKFIEEKLSDVLKQEENNTTHVYFHRCGSDWIVVERSAYAVCKRYSLNKDLILLDHFEKDKFVVLLLVDDSTMMRTPLNVKIPIFPYCQWKQTLYEDR